MAICPTVGYRLTVKVRNQIDIQSWHDMSRHMRNIVDYVNCRHLLHSSVVKFEL